VVPDGLQIGYDDALDQKRFFVTKQGVVLVTKDMLRSLR
jgi:ADP-glucose pyrophosphorylase